MTNAMAGFKVTSSKKASGFRTLNSDKENSYRNAPSLTAAALVFARNFLTTVVIGSAMLLQGPDGGIHDWMGHSWSRNVALLCALGLILNFRKLRTLMLALEATHRRQVAGGISHAGLNPVSA
jgi:hypothetical protein